MKTWRIILLILSIYIGLFGAYLLIAKEDTRGIFVTLLSVVPIYFSLPKQARKWLDDQAPDY